MAEYIDKQAFLDHMKGTSRYFNVKFDIENFPAADVVPVVRCKGCKYLVNATVNANGFLICDISDMEIAPDDFCSYGEPKEGAHADNHD